MYIFRRPDYRSEATEFLAQIKTARPELAVQQRTGLALLWDKVVDRAGWVGYRSAKVAQQPYVYQTKPGK
ncbi:MAG: DUF3460 family protein [Burkholderiales bacterium]